MTRDILLNNLCPTDTTFDCWNGDEICNCDDCNRVLNKWLDDYEKHVIEQYKASTNLKDTIKDIHDNVAHEMYCKGIDDFAKAIICELKNKHTDMPIVDILGSREKWKEKNSQYLECENLAYKIAKKLKAGGKNE